MENKKVFGKIIALELICFFTMIVSFWLCEIVELPHLLLGSSETPINAGEACIETSIFLVCGGWMVLQTRRLIKQIRYLEGFLHVCAFCQKINIDGEWIPLQTYIKQQTEAQISHSFCPECYAKHFGLYDQDAMSDEVQKGTS